MIMDAWGCFWIGLCIAACGYFIGNGLNVLGEHIREALYSLED
jgi:hypothetical protein